MLKPHHAKNLILKVLRKYKIKSIRNKNKHFSYIHNSASNISLFLEKYPKGKNYLILNFSMIRII